MAVVCDWGYRWREHQRLRNSVMHVAGLKSITRRLQAETSARVTRESRTWPVLMARLAGPPPLRFLWLESCTRLQVEPCSLAVSNGSALYAALGLRFQLYRLCQAISSVRSLSLDKGGVAVAAGAYSFRNSETGASETLLLSA